MHAWDMSQLVGAAAQPGSWTPPQPDGLYEPLDAAAAAAQQSAVNALAVAPAPGDGGCGRLDLLAAHESGVLCYYSAKSVAAGMY